MQRNELRRSRRVSSPDDTIPKSYELFELAPHSGIFSQVLRDRERMPSELRGLRALPAQMDAENEFSVARNPRKHPPLPPSVPRNWGFEKLPPLKNESWNKPALFSAPKAVMKKGRLAKLRCMHGRTQKSKRKGKNASDLKTPREHHFESPIQLQRSPFLGMDAVLCFARLLAKTTATAHARARRSLCDFFHFFQKIV